MSCYMRHMAWLFDALDLPNDTKNRKRVDNVLHELLGFGDGDCHCPEVWAAVKAMPEEDRDDLIAKVGDALGR